MNALGDELQGLLTQLISQARELGSRGIYRGEPEPFRRVSSGLYRQLHEIDDQYFDINSAQRRWIERARQYAPYLSDDDVLTSLQHLGGKTNLIDFTRDLNIALFFASYHSPDKDGRVLLMEQPLVSRDQGDVIAPYKLLERGTPANMTDVQKSLWVEPEKGYIDEEHVTTVEIPSALKPEILSHLQVVYGIEASRLRRSTTTCRGLSATKTRSSIMMRSGTRAFEPARRVNTIAHSTSSTGANSFADRREWTFGTTAPSRPGMPIGGNRPLLTSQRFGAVPPAMLGRSRKRWKPRTRRADSAAMRMAAGGPIGMSGFPPPSCSPDSSLGWSVTPK